MAQHDYDIANQSFPSFRSDLNSVLESINTSNSGTSRPTSAVAGTIWLDTTSASTPTLKFYDGSDDISLATLDYTANTVNWLDSTVSVNIVSDTTPQLGGDLDVNGNSIVSVANGNITITPDGTGKVVIDGLSYPTADGTADQILKTDGAGNLSFADASGGGTQWQSSIKTSAFTAVAGEGYWIDTTSGAITMTLPSSASVGDTIEIVDYARTWGTNRVTINRNGLNIQGGTENPMYDVNGQSVRLVYSGATKGWIPTVDDDVTDEGTAPPVSAEYLVVAGGGGAGNGANRAGGGGAGGLLTNYGGTAIELSGGTTYTITVGAGGSAGSSSDGSNGSDSVISGTGISTITAIGGGGGGANNTAGLDGGSGGGGYQFGVGGSGTVGQGNDGGNGNDPNPASGGGGGGAGQAGQDATTSYAGYGGDGLQNSITGTATYYAGGGGGTIENSGYPVGAGGQGGGAGGAHAPAGNGTANTGGGGGSGWASSGSGGSGVVFLRVATADYSGTTTGSPTVTTDGTDTIMKFTASGSYTA
jgi:hypothetical protein